MGRRDIAVMNKEEGIMKEGRENRIWWVEPLLYVSPHKNRE
jgi:hypothetical protein